MAFADIDMDELLDLDRAFTAAKMAREAAARALPISHTGPIRTALVIRHAACQEALDRIAGWVNDDLA